MRNRFRRFGEILKVEDQPDGTIMVFGIASSGSRDEAGEIITPDAMKAALPDYSKFPALREMHSSSAAGRVTEAYVDDDGFTQIAAHVVDPIAITKVKTKTYAGFSVGGKVTKRDETDRSIINGIKLVEVSLVDSPCNPDAVLTMWKADMSDYNPKSEDVVAEAQRLATEAGSKQYKNFLFKAREGLIAKALEADLGDEDDTGDEDAIAAAAAEAEEAAKAAAAPAADDDPPAVDDPAAEPAAEPVADPEDIIDPPADTEKVAGAEDAPADPVDALNAAIAKATEAAAPAPEVVEPVTGPFANFGKAADALRTIAINDTNPLAKGLYMVGRVAELMQSFQYVCESVNYEAEREGDNSPQPGQAAAALSAMGTLLITMAQEEVAEALAGVNDEAGVCIEYVGAADAIELAGEIVDLVKADADLMEKAGARNSKTDAAHLQAAHDHLTKMGATCDKANCGEDGEAEKVAGLEAENERLNKALVDAVPGIEKLTGEIEGLKKRLEEVEAAPAAPKTLAGSLRAVSKVEDISPDNAPVDITSLSPEDFQKALNALPEKERGELLIRIALKNPHLIQAPRAAA